MTWSDWLLRRLPLASEARPDDEPAIVTRPIETTMERRGVQVPVVLYETVTVSGLLDLFGEAMGPEPPADILPEPVYQAVLARADEMGSAIWREHWEKWRAEGRI